jgi:nitroreductase
MNLADAIRNRRSVRGFLPDPVPRPVLARMFELAQRAPSWCNIQPWRVALTSPPLTGRLVARLGEVAQTTLPAPEVAFPGEYPEPYLAHRRACGAALYQAMGVARNDHVGRKTAWFRNFEAFGAPHIAVVSVDRRLLVYAVLDIGCWLQTLLLCATAEGLASCPQASLASYPGPLRELLDIPEGEVILCGVAIGYEAKDVLANRCYTERAPADQNVRWLGFEP